MSELEIANVETFDLTLLANFVHQVVNPLNGVAGTLDNLADGTISEERREQRLNVARAQLEQCISLMRNLAYLARGFSKISEDDKKVVVLPQVIIESAMFFQEEGETRKIRISLRDRVTQNRIAGHPDLIRQVLMNVFDNCIKYGAEVSDILVDQRIQRDSGMAIIEIRSKSRLPVSQDEMARFFDLGFRGTNAKRIIASGTGLGLYICKKIIEVVHGGQMMVQAEGKDGLLFIIKIPDGELR